ncbi:hypothetical protein GF362_02545 [Candidatus Dojkabacteria bacterium]|nr:hypothetical protein [Candidatus Dojkabacteria bacterium]
MNELYGDLRPSRMLRNITSKGPLSPLEAQQTTKQLFNLNPGDELYPITFSMLVLGLQESPTLHTRYDTAASVLWTCDGTSAVVCHDCPCADPMFGICSGLRDTQGIMQASLTWPTHVNSDITPAMLEALEVHGLKACKTNGQ